MGKTKTRKMSNRHIRNEVFLLIVLFQQYLFRNETQSVINLLNDSTSLIVMVFGFLYLIMKIIGHLGTRKILQGRATMDFPTLLLLQGRAGQPWPVIICGTMKIPEVHNPPFPPCYKHTFFSQMYCY
jgi:hypothetical protein